MNLSLVPNSKPENDLDYFLIWKEKKENLISGLLPDFYL